MIGVFRISGGGAVAIAPVHSCRSLVEKDRNSMLSTSQRARDIGPYQVAADIAPFTRRPGPPIPARDNCAACTFGKTRGPRRLVVFMHVACTLPARIARRTCLAPPLVFFIVLRASYFYRRAKAQGAPKRPG